MIKLVQKKSAQPHPRPEKANAATSSELPAHVRFPQVYDLVADGIRIIDNDFNILFLNSTFRTLTKPGHDVFFGAKCYNVFSSRKCHTDECPLQRLRSGAKEVKCRVVSEGSDGAPRRGTSTSRPLWGPKNQLAGMITGFQDTTEIEEARRTLEDIEQMLASETRTLEAKQTALREVLNQLEDERNQLSLRIKTNLERVVFPLMHGLSSRLDSEERLRLEEIKHSLSDLLSPFVNSLTARFMSLTPREIEICNLIKYGLSTKEIASRIMVSEQTVFKQRRNIRKKLRIADGETNLSAYLQNL